MNQILKFEKDNCQPCNSLSMWLNDNNIKHESKNIMQNMDLLKKYNIKSVPTLLLLDQEGNEIDRVIGFDINKIKALVS